MFFSIFFLWGSSSFGQSREELLLLGDNAFEKKHYASAAYFYKKIITGQDHGVSEIIYPYLFKHSNKDFSKETSKVKANENSTDSLQADSLISIPITKVEKDSLGEVLQITHEDVEVSYARHRLAEAYRLDYNYIKAEEAYKNAIEHPHEIYASSKYWYGVILMNNEKYEEAKEVFIGFIGESTEKPALSSLRKQAKQMLRSCSYALKYAQPRTDLEVLPADSLLNMGEASTSAAFFDNGQQIMFSNATENTEAHRHNEPSDFDVYMSNLSNENWTSPTKVNGPINTYNNEGATSMDSIGTKLYFTRCESGLCAIYVSKYFNNMWMQPMKLNEHVNQEGYSSMHPSISKDGKVLYFSSNKPGGKGGFDIYSTQLDRWGNPDSSVNLGPGQNTAENEIAPFYHQNTKTLYYSSNGLKGYGGYDVFNVVYNDAYGYGRPINMKKSINSGKDDIYFTLNPDGNKGFLSSDRIDCEECPTGNCLKLFQVNYSPNTFFVDGYIYDADTQDPIKGARVSFRDVHADTIMYIVKTDAEGYYSHALQEGFTYFIKAQKRRYFGDATDVSTENLKKSESFIRDLFLTPIPLSEINIPGIEYDYNSANLRPSSKEVLMETVEFLLLNDNLVIEIRSHTDVRGSDQYNLDLSKRRAKSVVDFLIENGINKGRLVSKGLGETELLIENAQTEEEHQKNRRTTFKVLSEDFVE